MGNENGSVNPQVKNSPNAEFAELKPVIDPSLLNSLERRLIGPFRGGRVVAVAGDPVQNLVFYFGLTGGGVWKTTDGGLIWQNVSDGFFKRASVGAIAVSDSDPNVVYVGMGETTIRSNVSHGDGVYKSTDGGKTWTEITRKPGLPKGLLGKIGLAVSPARENRVWAVIDAEDGAVFRSDDGGENWERLSEDRNLRARPWYYQHIYADPQDPEIVWVLNVQAWKSVDGGRTFFEIYIPHGDHHDLWIDPYNPQRMIQGNDGGACISFNGGTGWSTIYNQPTAEFYHVTTDTQVPYRVYAAQQDNSTISLPSRSALAGITQSDSYEVGGGESGYIAVRPDNPNIVFAGNYHGYLTRYDHRSRQDRNITVWPEAATGWGAKDVKYRFQWTFPTMLSPHDPNVLYVTGNHVFRSTNEGDSWEILSPDLTRNDIT